MTTLAAGHTLSHYTILGPLGSGAMGEVYRARDTRLDREVAIKVLPEHFAKDQERLQRFGREAKSLASLNHPNVAQIHGVDRVGDTSFLVLELVPGETLAERVSRGPLAVEEALHVCVQIASGLEAAHEAGVIHRDLKPGNVKLTPEGKAKVLDFGLARQQVARERPSSVAGPLTEEGVMLGTPGYMSPEQLRGQPIDRRTDVFAFGCVLYACLVGTAAFPGESPSDVIAATLESEPDLEALPRKTSARVRELLAKCLEKDVAHRLRDIGDARIELERAIANKEWSTARIESVPGRRSTWRELRPWLAAGALGAAIALAIVVLVAPRILAGGSPPDGRPPAVTRFVVNPKRLLAAAEYETTATLAISPDGARIAFVGNEGRDRDPQLFLREISDLDATPVTGGTLGYNPFFSPDGEWLGFTDVGVMWKVSVAGGPRTELHKARGFPKGATWGPGGILESPAPNTGLFRLSPDGGPLHEATRLDASAGELSHRWPELLPDGRHVLCTVKKASLTTFDDAEIVVYALDGHASKTVLRGGFFARYASSGHLLFAKEGAIMAAPFDLDRLEVTGPAVRVVPGVMTEPASGAAQFAVSRNGTLVYAPGGPVEGLIDLAWVDRAGTETPAGVPARPLRNIVLSPDGERVAMCIAGASDAIFVYDLARGTLARATFDGNSSTVLWMPDGKDLIYESDRDSGGTFRSRADGSGTPTKLALKSLSSSRMCLVGTTSTLVYAKGEFRSRDIWSFSLEPGAVEVPVVVRPFDQWDPQVSPDGKWLSYISDESGREEIYVSPFPAGEGRWQISKNGSECSNWSGDGKALYYLDGIGSAWLVAGPQTLVSVAISTADGFQVGAPETVFKWNGLAGHALSPDGQRVLFMRQRAPPAQTTEIHAVQNWLEELKKLVPAPARR